MPSPLAALLPDPPPDVQRELTLARVRREPHLGWQYVAGFLGFAVANTALGVGAALGSALTLTIGLLLEAVIGFLLWHLLIRRLAQRPDYEFSRPGWAGELGAGLALGIGVICLAVGVVALAGGYRVTGVQFGPGVLVGLAIGIGPGVAEEVLFRGVLLRLLDKQVGSWAALAITSVLFGLIHLDNSGAGLFGAVAIMIEAGLLLGAAYLLTRRLWLAVGLHAGWNLAQAGIFSINVSGSGLGQDGLLRAQLHGPDWLTGGPMGIEGSLVTIVIGLAVGLWLLSVAWRRGRLGGRVGRDAPEIPLPPTTPNG